MATSFDVNLTIGSALGFTVVGGAFTGYFPKIETYKDLDSDTETTPVGYDGLVRLLSVEPLATFETAPGHTSTFQTVIMTNNGTAALTITNVTYSVKEGIQLVADDYLQHVFDFNTVTNTTGTITIAPGSTSSFDIAYYGEEPGYYSNRLIIFSNNSAGPYKIFTNQTVFNTSSFDVVGGDFYVYSDVPGEPIYRQISITPRLNYVNRTDLQWPITANITEASQGWAVSEVGNNYATVVFKPNYVSNVNGLYTATFVLSAPDVPEDRIVTGTVELDIDYNKYRPLGAWLSPAASNNSIVGISYDVINNIRTITIGVGMGGDVTTEYFDGGNVFATTNSLGIFGSTLDYKYIPWATVYRFPLEDNQTYYSGDKDIEDNFLYKVKASTEYNYEDYYGVESHSGSMFVVQDLGSGNVSIKMNILRELAYDPEEDKTNFNITLQNLSRAFYYYSDVDLGTRYNLSPAPIMDGTVTEQFYGFNNSGTVITQIVSLPLPF